MAEPWNAVTAAFFVVIVLVWVVRLRGRYGRYPFVTAALPILLAGGIGGTLYHAHRTQFAYFLLDVVPIQILGVAASAYLAVRLGRAYGPWRVTLTSAGLISVFAATIVLMRFTLPRLPWQLPPTAPVNFSYALLAILIVIPLAVVLVRTRFRYAGFVAAGLVCFAQAWFFRLVDGSGLIDLPMGTHWLWHTLGAGTTVLVFEYFYRIEGRSFEELASRPSPMHAAR